MRLFPLIILFFLLSSFAIAENPAYPENYSLDVKFNFSSFLKDQGSEVSIAKIIGGLVLAFLLISGVYFQVRKKKK